MSQEVQTMINPQNGNLAFKLFSFDSNCHFDHLQRHNYFSLIWVKKGRGSVRADFAEHAFESGSLFAFSPYQPFMLSADAELEGEAICFHPDFFCIHLHQKEVACNGVLFNNVYQPPFTLIDAPASEKLAHIVSQMRDEMQDSALAQYELLVSYLKIFLITATRLKMQQQPKAQADHADAREPFILQNLKDAIETHFKTKHSPSQYADLLNISPKQLAKITKTHFQKTLTDIIAERIVIEAKRELYLSNKTVKEIAYELGYEDEYYFSRFFKANADVSPQLYRETVGFGRGMAT
jgi:AraC family transcriptional regulator, transcriptional activator of pobA